MATTQRAPSPRPTRDRPARRFPWHALAVTVAASTAAAGAVAPELLDPPETVAGPARSVAWLVLAVAVPLVVVLAVLAARRTTTALTVLRDLTFLAVVLALCTVAESQQRALVLGIAVVGLFLWGSPDDD